LKKRGEAIRADEFEKVDKIEAKINQLKERDLDKLTRPCSAFVTFENEEGFKRATKFNEISAASDNLEIQSFPIFIPGIKPIRIKPASEPSDIIWENRMLTTRHRRIRKLVVAVVMFLALLGSIIFIF
jgi:hypothetical protein